MWLPAERLVENSIRNKTCLDVKEPDYAEHIHEGDSGMLHHG